jgi:hypothetical protein
MRALARRLSRQLPQSSYDDISLLIGDSSLAQDAQRFFSQTPEALRYAAEHAPRSYAKFRKDVKTIVLRAEAETTTAPYNPFQLAVLVPANLIEADASAYSAWLLYVSGLSSGTREAIERASEVLQTIDPEQRESARLLLPQVDE